MVDALDTGRIRKDNSLGSLPMNSTLSRPIKPARGLLN